jgi:putative FmdB family regulatory protein
MLENCLFFDILVIENKGEFMPKYDYKCSICSSQVEFEKSIGDDNYPVCCNESMQRLWSAPAAIFNGSGFYSTDSKKKK